MKSIAITLIFVIIIAIISFFIIISLYIHFLNLSEKYKCYNLYKMFSFDIPEECKEYVPFVDKIFLNYSTIDEIEKAIAIYISRCWVRSGRGLKKEKIICFSLEIPSNLNGFLNFTTIRNYIKEYSDVDPNIIYVIPNNLEAIHISNKTTILIIYNVTNIILW